MPLIDGYAVLVGTLRSYECDNDRDEGGYYHCTIRVQSRQGIYRCVVDLDSKQQKDGLHWRALDLGETDMHGLASLDAGLHFLASNPESGALDYLRSPELQPMERCVKAGRRNAVAEHGGCAPWKYGTSRDAFADLSGVLDKAERLLVFGEPFRAGKGMHNVHQNQGDPPESRWSQENGIWQDGAVAGIGEDGVVRIFLSRFKTQALQTDDRGKPAAS